MTVADILNEAVVFLADAGSPTPRLDAEVLLAACLRLDRLLFITHPEDEVNPDAVFRYKGWLQRRGGNEPVSYITGTKEFWSLPFLVTPAVLIPRPETEVLVEETLACMPSKAGKTWQVLEVGTGSGAVAVALASERPDIQITATDVVPEALAIARANAEANGVQDRITFLQGNMLEPVSGRFDLIVSNPPYISRHDYDSLPPGIREYEPMGALVPGPEGTEAHGILIQESPSFLYAGGWLLMEMDGGQVGTLRRLFNKRGRYENLSVRSDYGGMERVIRARRI
ncbi:MAG: peptide chain release factor N(5)-glutamine methyltransferase [Deltaproteobacteria bacterium]|jgi:release factor glutamine methyltransferase|nr:peptide chain release factor N(5)-glutamine methyltransferase [Deltaproteobacteria bacterium]